MTKYRRIKMSKDLLPQNIVMSEFRWNDVSITKEEALEFWKEWVLRHKDFSYEQFSGYVRYFSNLIKLDDAQNVPF